MIKKVLALMLLGALSLSTHKLEASKTAAAGLGITSLGVLGTALEAEMRQLSPEQRAAMGFDDSASMSKNPTRALKNAAQNRARFFKQVYHNMRANGLRQTIKEFPYLFGGIGLATLSAGAATYQAVKPTASQGPDAAEQERLRLEAEQRQRDETERLRLETEHQREQELQAKVARFNLRHPIQPTQKTDDSSAATEQQLTPEQDAYFKNIIASRRAQKQAEQERLANLAAAQAQEDFGLGSFFGHDDEDEAANQLNLTGNDRPLPETPPQREARLRLEAERQAEQERIQREEEERARQAAQADTTEPSASVLVSQLDELLQDFDSNTSISASVIAGFGEAPDIPLGQPVTSDNSAFQAQSEPVEIPSSLLVPPSSSSSSFDVLGSSDPSASFLLTVDHLQNMASSSSPSSAASPVEELDALLRSQITAVVPDAFHTQVNERRQRINNSFDNTVIDARTATDKARDKFTLFSTPMTHPADNCIRNICYIAGYRAAQHNNNSIRAAEEAMNVAYQKLCDTNKQRIEASQYNEYYQDALAESLQAATAYTQRLHAYAQAKPAFRAHIHEQAQKLAVATEIATAVTQSYLETAPQTNELEQLLTGIHAENIFAAAFTTVVEDQNSGRDIETIIQHAADTGIAAIHTHDDSALRSFVAASESLLMSSRSVSGLPTPTSASSSSSQTPPPPPPAPPIMSQHLRRISESQQRPAPLNFQDAITQKARNLNKVDRSSGRAPAPAAPNAFDAMFQAMQQRQHDPSGSLSLTTGNQSLLVSSIMLSINASRGSSSEMNWQAIDRLGDNQIIPSFLHKTLLDLRDDIVKHDNLLAEPNDDPATRKRIFTEAIYGTNQDHSISPNVGIFVKKIINIVGMQAYALHPSVEYINARVRAVVTHILNNHASLFRGYSPVEKDSHEPILVEIARRYNQIMAQQQDLTEIYQIPKTDFAALAPSSSSSSGSEARRDEQLAQGAQQLAVRLQAISAAIKRNDSDYEEDDWSDDE